MVWGWFFSHYAYTSALLVFLLVLPAQSAPYPPSPVIKSVSWDFANLVRLAPGSDLWPMTWGPDNNLYTSWGDGGGFGGTNRLGRVSLGFARIEGLPPEFKVINVWGGYHARNPATFGGKSLGMLSLDGVLYAWLNTQSDNPPSIKLIWSSDFGMTWQHTPWELRSDEFAPSTILNFGKNYVDARDDFVYVYGGPWGYTANVYLARVPKGQITSWAAYEFFKGFQEHREHRTPDWTSDISERTPVFTDLNLANEFNGARKASVVYNSGIERYLMTVPHGGPGKLGIFDAPEPWGPWTTVAYYDNWGGFGTKGEALAYIFPTKWMSPDGKTMWTVFSATGVLDSFNLVKATLTLK